MFDHYAAVDWAFANMAIARMTTKSNKITTFDVPSESIRQIRHLSQIQKNNGRPPEIQGTTFRSL